MIWTSFEDYETLLQRQHDATAGARQARKRIRLMREFVNETPAAQRIRAGLAARARRLERQRAEVERELDRRTWEAA